MKGLWQSGSQQVCGHHFSNSFCSLPVSGSHVGNSQNISNLLILSTWVSWAMSSSSSQYPFCPSLANILLSTHPFIPSSLYSASVQSPLPNSSPFLTRTFWGLWEYGLSFEALWSLISVLPFLWQGFLSHCLSQVPGYSLGICFEYPLPSIHTSVEAHPLLWDVQITFIPSF